MPSTQTAEQEKSPGKARKSCFTSYALLAGLLIVGTNALAMATLKPDPIESPNRCWAYWAAKDWKTWQSAEEKTQKPDFAFFGSSLMVAVVNDGDSTYLKKPFDAVKHHRSLYFENYAGKVLGKPVTTHSFAIGGQMASDAAALFATLPAKESARPTLIWGVAPRDLIDASFSDPASTETVRYLDKVAYPNDALPESKRVWKRLERVIEQAFHIYGSRADFQCILRNIEEKLLTATLGTSFEQIKIPQPLLKIAMAEQPEENFPGQWQVTPYSMKAAENALWVDNSKEYRMRYQPFKPKIFANQSKYMEKFLSLAKQKGFRVVVVNMPLCTENTSLLPDGVYDKFVGRVKELAQNNGAAFLDCNRSGLFNRADFCDPVHLHGPGGQKLLRVIADSIAQTSSVAEKASADSLKSNVLQ
ncbi:MAG: hypothetical protein IAF58_05640 [Leptolyngbya sp.]|nr:hypothetical protein [Candidatus Melainabacteria bacterium]